MNEKQKYSDLTGEIMLFRKSSHLEEVVDRTSDRHCIDYFQTYVITNNIPDAFILSPFIQERFKFILQ